MDTCADRKRVTPRVNSNSELPGEGPRARRGPLLCEPPRRPPIYTHRLSVGHARNILTLKTTGVLVGTRPGHPQLPSWLNLNGPAPGACEIRLLKFTSKPRFQRTVAGYKQIILARGPAMPPAGSCCRLRFIHAQFGAFGNLVSTHSLLTSRT